MAKPTGAIEFGGGSADDQFYSLSSMSGQTDTDYPAMYAYVFVPWHRMPGALSSDSEDDWMYTINIGSLMGVPTDDTAIASYTIDGGVSCFDVIVGSGDGSTATWQEAEFAKTPVSNTKTMKYIDSEIAFIKARYSWSHVPESVGTCSVSGISLEETADTSYSYDAAAIARDSKRIYGAHEFLSAYHGQNILCDTLNMYTQESRIWQTVPVFGNFVD